MKNAASSGHVPLPKGKRPIREVKTPTGLDWEKHTAPKAVKVVKETDVNESTIFGQCDVCKSPVFVRYRKTCSPECAQVLRAENAENMRKAGRRSKTAWVPRPCAHCGKDFVPSKFGRTVCSDECATERRVAGRKRRKAINSAGCSSEGCGKDAVCRGMCGAHYAKWRRSLK